MQYKKPIKYRCLSFKCATSIHLLETIVAKMNSKMAKLSLMIALIAVWLMYCEVESLRITTTPNYEALQETKTTSVNDNGEANCTELPFYYYPYIILVVSQTIGPSL